MAVWVTDQDSRSILVERGYFVVWVKTGWVNRLTLFCPFILIKEIIDVVFTKKQYYKIV